MIKETNDYTLQCGPSNTDQQLCYQVVNKEYGVIEVETSILPQGLKYLMDIQLGLVDIKAQIKSGVFEAEDLGSNVTPIGKLN